jgi:predicted glycosyltransferase
MGRTIRRILAYTHNSIGVGHAFRTLAVITGIKHHRPEIDFLVLSGSSLPCLFLSNGIDVVKLPSIRKDVDTPEGDLFPRYLRSFETQAVLEYRRRVIVETFEFFSPDVVMIEHYIGGLDNEALPLIGKNPNRERRRREWSTVYLSRGVCPSLGCALTGGLGEGVIDIARRFDRIYVFEDPEKVDSNHGLLAKVPDLRGQMRYMGPITARTISELSGREEVIGRLGLLDMPLILLSLGRHGPVVPMARAILSALRRRGTLTEHQVVMVLDPYLEHEAARALQDMTSKENVRVLPFTPHLVDLVNIAELVICRAGYNTVNELLMTGVASMVIPERHPGGEQEHRARRIQRENVLVVYQEEVLSPGLPDLLEDLLARKRKPVRDFFDKYAIGGRIAQDLENLRPRDERPGCR